MPVGPEPQETRTATAAELPEGTRLLDRYTIIDRVGSGGMASIYRAMDDRLDRVVCVKLLRLVLEGSGSAAGGSVYQATYSHFLQEALALSKLQHPNTLRIYDFGYLAETGRPFQISEYLDGGNLEGRVRRGGPLDREAIERILEPMTAAVTEAHENRIIHRDIKPSNILFARIGEILVPKLADFGIARSELKKARNADDPPTPDAHRAAAAFPSAVEDPAALGSIALFSPRWAAPEQLCGAPEGAYTDVYALGLVTLFMLTGRTPFDEKDVRATFNARVQSDDLLRRRLRDRMADGPLLPVLTSALTADPSARIRTPAEFYTRVRDVLRPRVPSTPPPRSSVVPLPFPLAPPVSGDLPATRLPHAGLHGGVPLGLPPLRAKVDSVTVELEAVLARGDHREEQAEALERVETVGGYRVRIVDVNDVLDFTRTTPTGGELRFRITMVAVTNTPLRINIKGLNCFVAWADRAARPTPAIVAGQDGSVDLISAQREKLGRLSWSFGTPTHTGRVFLVDGEELMIPYDHATYAVVVHLGDDRELVAMCKRA